MGSEIFWPLILFAVLIASLVVALAERRDDLDGGHKGN